MEEFFENLHQTFFFINIPSTCTQAVFQTQAIFFISQVKQIFKIFLDCIVMGESHDQILPLSTSANSCCSHKRYFLGKLCH